MFYLVKIGHELVAKNRLQKEIQDYFKSLDRTLIKLEDLPLFLLNVEKTISAINAKNNRCQAIKFEWHKPHKHYSIKSEQPVKANDLSLHVTNSFIIMDLLFTNKPFVVE